MELPTRLANWATISFWLSSSEWIEEIRTKATSRPVTTLSFIMGLTRRLPLSGMAAT
jgi:hypothetical protein